MKKPKALTLELLNKIMCSNFFDLPLVAGNVPLDGPKRLVHELPSRDVFRGGLERSVVNVWYVGEGSRECVMRIAHVTTERTPETGEFAIEIIHQGDQTVRETLIGYDGTRSYARIPGYHAMTLSDLVKRQHHV